MPPYLSSFPLGPWFATQLLLIFYDIVGSLQANIGAGIPGARPS